MSDATEILTTSPRPGGNVLRLPFALRGPALDYPRATQVLRYWDSLRGTRPAPARAEIDPRNIPEALECTFIAEFVTPDIARLRIAGHRFEDLLGMDPRGMPLGVFFSLEARDELAQALAQVAQGARAQLPLRGESGLGRPGLDGLLVLLPLTDAAGAITRVLGALETHGQIGRAPRRFKLAAQAARITTTSPAASPAPDAAAAALRPEPATRQPARPRPTGRPVLRVIRGGRDQ